MAADVADAKCNIGCLAARLPWEGGCLGDVKKRMRGTWAEIDGVERRRPSGITSECGWASTIQLTSPNLRCGVPTPCVADDREKRMDEWHFKEVSSSHAELSGRMEPYGEVYTHFLVSTTSHCKSCNGVELSLPWQTGVMVIPSRIISLRNREAFARSAPRPGYGHLEDPGLWSALSVPLTSTRNTVQCPPLRFQCGLLTPYPTLDTLRPVPRCRAWC